MLQLGKNHDTHTQPKLFCTKNKNQKKKKYKTTKFWQQPQQEQQQQTKANEKAINSIRTHSGV